VRFERIGVYGLGFLYVTAASMVVYGSRKVRFAGLAASVLLAAMMYVPAPVRSTVPGSLNVAGVQLEEPDEQQAASALDRLAIAHPEAQVLVLSEYSFLGPVPQSVRDVVRKHRRYLIAGGMKLLPGEKFFDTAFVIAPDGRDLFEQPKSVPVQLMDDGLPAPDRHVWDSPWGKIGIGVCYDISYARVMDDFVRQGAQGIIVPTMDPAKWGQYERRMLHGRLAPVRAAEYGIPIFGVWSSGESQLVDRRGRIIATANYPGQGQMIAGPFDLRDRGSIPPDRLLAIGSMAATALLILLLAYRKLMQRLTEARGDRGRLFRATGVP
jgi:apolipoprotein N-acyltransferase